MAKIEIGVGFSKNPDIEEAVKEASVKLRSEIFSPKIDLCLIFFNFSEREIKKLFFNIKRILNPSLTIGFSLPLLIAEEEIFSKGLILVSFSNTEVTGGCSHLTGNILEEAEKFIWRLLRVAKGKKREFFLCFANFSQAPLDFLRGLERGLGRSFPLVGMFSWEEVNPSSCFLLYNEEVLKEGIVGALFLDNLEIFSGIDSGFSPLGREAKIDSFSKDTIYRIDGFPAIEFYKNYFGEKVKESSEYFQRVSLRYPLGFKFENFPNYIISSPIKLNPDGSLKLLKEVLSTEVRITIPLREKLINSVEAMVKKAKVRNPRIAIFFDSFVRYKFLKFFYTSQLRALKNALGDVPLVGGISFYSLGLLSSFDLDLGHFIGENSFSLLLLREK